MIPLIIFTTARKNLVFATGIKHKTRQIQFTDYKPLFLVPEIFLKPGKEGNKCAAYAANTINFRKPDYVAKALIAMVINIPRPEGRGY